MVKVYISGGENRQSIICDGVKMSKDKLKKLYGSKTSVEFCSSANQQIDIVLVPDGVDSPSNSTLKKIGKNTQMMQWSAFLKKYPLAGCGGRVSKKKKSSRKGGAGEKEDKNEKVKEVSDEDVEEEEEKVGGATKSKSKARTSTTKSKKASAKTSTKTSTKSKSTRSKSGGNVAPILILQFDKKEAAKENNGMKIIGFVPVTENMNNIIAWTGDNVKKSSKSSNENTVEGLIEEIKKRGGIVIDLRTQNETKTVLPATASKTQYVMYTLT